MEQILFSLFQRPFTKIGNYDYGIMLTNNLIDIIEGFLNKNTRLTIIDCADLNNNNLYKKRKIVKQYSK